MHMLLGFKYSYGKPDEFFAMISLSAFYPPIELNKHVTHSIYRKKILIFAE